MRVLVLSYLFPRPDSPWSGIFVAEQVAALRAAGMDAKMLWGNSQGPSLRAPPASPPTWNTDNCVGVPAISFNYSVPRGLGRYLASQFYARSALAACRRFVQDFPFDLVHAHTSLLDGYAATLIGAAFGVPVVLTEHSGPFSTQIDNFSKRRTTGRALRNANKILAVSGFMKDQMVAAFPFLKSRDIAIVGNGVCSDTFPLAPQMIDSEAVTALWVGGFLAIKQPLMMLRAFARARLREPKLKLRIVGEGPLETQMRAAADELGILSAVSWPGSLGRAEVANEMAAANFLVVSSQAETFSLVTLEALTTGRPVLTTRCGGPEEIIGSKEFGMIVDNDERGLEDGFCAMARQCCYYDAHALRAAAISRFGHPAIAHKLVEIYQTLLSREAT